MGGGAEDRHHLLQLMPIDRRTSRRRSKAAPPRSAKQAERRHDRKPRRTPGPEIDSVLLCSTVFVLDSLFYHSLFCDSQFCNSLSSCREVANHRWLIILIPRFEPWYGATGPLSGCAPKVCGIELLKNAIDPLRWLAAFLAWRRPAPLMTPLIASASRRASRSCSTRQPSRACRRHCSRRCWRSSAARLELLTRSARSYRTAVFTC